MNNDQNKERNKKILFATLIIIIAVALGLLVYWFFFRGPSATPVPPGFPSATSTTPGFPIYTGGGTGSENPPYVNPPTSTTPPGGGTPSVFKPILRLVSDTPVGGGITFKRGSVDYTRYIDRAKGNVFETDAKNIKPARISNTTISQAEESHWSPDGVFVVARFLRELDIQSFLASVKGGELQGVFLPKNINNIDVSPSGKQLFYFAPTNDGVAGIITDWNKAGQSQVFSSPLKNWLVDWPNNQKIFITSKANGGSAGIAISINVNSGKNETALSGIKGLTTLPNPAGDKLLYSESDNKTVNLFIRDLVGGSSSGFVFETLPEKCVWSRLVIGKLFCAVPETMPSATYPDDWYQGTISFRDEIWEIEPGKGNVKLLMSLGATSGREFDAFNLSLNSEENFITMMNKNDLSLWTLQIAP